LIIGLSKEDYLQSLWFGLRLWYSKRSSRLDFRDGAKRDLGSFLNSVVAGKLAEQAFAYFLKKKFGIQAEPSFAISDKETKADTDILFPASSSRQKWLLRINVLSARPQAKYLIIDLHAMEKKYDAYVLVFVNLPKDHLVKLIAPLIRIEQDIACTNDEIKAEIAGYAWKEDIIERSVFIKKNSWLTDPENLKKRIVRMKNSCYVLPVKFLRKSESEWISFANRLLL
jgi:hypothetical protein